VVNKAKELLVEIEIRKRSGITVITKCFKDIAMLVIRAACLCVFISLAMQQLGSSQVLSALFWGYIFCAASTRQQYFYQSLS
jgi:hypothetical protein